MLPEPVSSTLNPELTSATPSRANRQVEALLERRWARWLLPSLTDLFFVAFLVWSFMSTGPHGWQSLLADGDVGWHIRTGDYIAAHHSVPHQDLFSFSKPNAPWFAWEWLADLADAGLHRAAGLKGIVLAAAVILGAFGMSLLLRMIMAGGHPFAALLVCLFGVGASSIHFLARPHIYTLLFLSVSMGLLEAHRRNPSPKTAARLWWLVPMALLWTNLHGGFLILVMALGLAAVGAAAEGLWARADGQAFDWKPARVYASLAAACTAASLVNPYGWGLHKHVVEYLRSDWIRNNVQEFQSPNFRGESMMQFEALLFIALIAAGVLIRKRRLVEGLWILAFSYLALSGARHIPVFVAALSPLIACEMSSWWRAWTQGKSHKSIPGILEALAKDLTPGFRRISLLPFVVVLLLMLVDKPVQWPHDFPSELFPTKMVHDHEAQIRASRVMTSDQWGDYLIYLNPNQKVFMDGRSDFYGPEIGNQLLHVMNGAPEWEQVLDQYHFDLALLPVDCALSQMLKKHPRWKVVEDDGKHIVLELRGSKVLPPVRKN